MGTAIIVTVYTSEDGYDTFTKETVVSYEVMRYGGKKNEEGWTRRKFLIAISVATVTLFAVWLGSMFGLYLQGFRKEACFVLQIAAALYGIVFAFVTRQMSRLQRRRQFDIATEMQKLLK